MAASNAFSLKKMGMSFKKKFSNSKPDRPEIRQSLSMDIKQSDSSEIVRAEGERNKDPEVAGPSKVDNMDNEEDIDGKTLVEKPLRGRQEREMSKVPMSTIPESTGSNQTVQVTKMQRIQQLAYEGLKESLRTVEYCTDVFPPLKSAARLVLEVVERYETVKAMPDLLGALASKLDLLVDILNSAGGRESINDRLIGLVSTFEEKSKLIAAKMERSMAARIIETNHDAAFIARELSAITFAIDIVMMDVNLKTNKTVNIIQETVSELRNIALLDKLKYAEGAGFNHEDRQGCTNGTRIMLLADLLSWATDLDDHHVFWLNGMAGTGKTTVAETFSNLLFQRGVLGSSFFCSRKKLDRRNVRLIFPALAKGLARKYPEFQTELLEVLKEDLDFTGLSLEDQYLTLILQPAEKAFAESSEPILLVVDALDECEDAQAAEIFLKTVLLRKPNCGLRLLVTSRPEPKIIKGFRSGAHSSLHLQDIEEHLVKADIVIFLGNKLKEVDDLYLEYGNTWPPAELQTIADQAGNLFIYAATAVKYISDDHGDPCERLAKFASIRPPVNAVETIDEVYSFVLSETFGHKLDVDEKDRVRTCLSMVVCALEPMSVSTYSVLLGITITQVRRAFSSLHSVVKVPEIKQDDETIMLYHASFSDYLTSDTRSASKPWLVNISNGHFDLANKCMEVMMSKLHFNVSQAHTSYKSNIDQGLTVATYWNYIGIFWATHIVYSIQPKEKIPPTLADIVEEFLEDEYLSWLEVLSVLNKVQVAPAALLTISKVSVPEGYLQCLCNEFAGFASSFLVPIQKSVPHIYISALSWVSSKSQMDRIYTSRFAHMPLIYDLSKTHGHEKLLLQLTGHQGFVTSVAFASEGNILVSGSRDKTVRIWNAETGEDILKPLHGHTAPVTSVAISPDGKFIASASEDTTIRIWDASTGKAVLKPLQGHTKTVTSIVFSSNGKFILSGSNDKAVCMWNAAAGGKPIKTFSGVRGSVTCVAFSPYTKYIACGSEDHTVYIWDVATQKQLGQPLKFHLDFISAVMFSPNGHDLLVACEDNTMSIWDFKKHRQRLLLKGHTNRITSAVYSKYGKYIVSGSRDSTVRLWDASTGKEICRPLHGHTERVVSVAFSNDEKSVASASWDKTIRVWNAQTSESFEPIPGHSDYVECVSFSHNNEYVVSGSRDQTICIWNVNTGDQKMKPLVGHTSRVTSLSVSPDGKHIASASRDKTLRLWEFSTGLEVINPIEGHTDYITCVRFNNTGEVLASGSWDKTVRLWDPSTGQQTAILDGNTDFISSVAFSADGKYIASGSFNHKVCIWDVASGNLIQSISKFHTDQIASVQFSPTGTSHIASGSWDNTICIWDYTTGDLALTLKGHTHAVTCIAYSPNGKYLASGSRDNTVCLWNTETGDLVFPPLYGHTYYVTSLHFSSDGRYLVSGGQDNLVRIWNIEAGSAGGSQESDQFMHNHASGTYVFKKDGWVYTESNELLMWIPPSKLYALYTPQTKCIFGEERITIDLSDFGHGTSWIETYE